VIRRPRSAREARVLHGPVEIAGQVAIAAYAIRAAGGRATSLAPPHRFAYDIAPDVSPPVRTDAAGRVRTRWYSPLRTAGLLARHDILHLHFAASYLPAAWGHPDARVLRRLGRLVLVQFHGSEVRRPSLEAELNPRYVVFEGEDDALALANQRRWAHITDGHCVLSDPGLEPHVRDVFPHVHLVPLCVDVRRFGAAPPDPARERPVVVHAPTDHAGKGTPAVRAAVDLLRAEGVAFEYRELHGASRAEVQAACAAADVVVDQLGLGSYGVFAVEAMAGARPVIANIRPDLAPLMAPGLPIVTADADTVAGELRALLLDGERRALLGAQGRAFAERVHDVPVLGRRLLELYDELL
jgi:glycosyltransferase involved in cell wall biosynthesis